MDRVLKMVTDGLLSASSQVGSAYFQLPVAGKEEPEYRERVYCYELYHRWRCHWPPSWEFSLSGEVDKSGAPLIRGSPKPDFLVHVPGQMKNLLVLEVKAKNADVDRMVEDLTKLTMFRCDLKDLSGQPANYHAAYFWIYGASGKEWSLLRDQIVEKVDSKGGVDLSLISCFLHERAGMPAFRVTWW